MQDLRIAHFQRGEGSPSVLSKRHLYNLSRLDPAEQEKLGERIGKVGLTAVETEEVVAGLIRPQSKPKVRQSGLAARQYRTTTSLADVVLTFRKT